jgi:hypothetical protein
MGVSWCAVKVGCATHMRPALAALLRRAPRQALRDRRPVVGVLGGSLPQSGPYQGLVDKIQVHKVKRVSQSKSGNVWL